MQGGSFEWRAFNGTPVAGARMAVPFDTLHLIHFRMLPLRRKKDFARSCCVSCGREQETKTSLPRTPGHQTEVDRSSRGRRASLI